MMSGCRIKEGVRAGFEQNKACWLPLRRVVDSSQTRLKLIFVQLHVVMHTNTYKRGKSEII